jgi:hypothetical protein
VRVLLALLAACIAGAAPATASPAASGPIPVTFVGDSVSASITLTPTARKQLERGLTMRLDAEVCRRLVEASCRHRGTRPTTGLQAVKSYGRSLGRVLVVNVGYNDGADGYGAGIDRVLRAALAQGATGVVWVTLHDASGGYRRMNAAIRSAARRWPALVVADWNAHSAGKPWFRRDGLHLNSAGATALASFVRPHVLSAAAG